MPRPRLKGQTRSPAASMRLMLTRASAWTASACATNDALNAVIAVPRPSAQKIRPTVLRGRCVTMSAPTVGNARNATSCTTGTSRPPDPAAVNNVSEVT
jgi:hypothetical protein